MINNSYLIRNMLPDTPIEDYTWYCQVIKRKKDHPGLEGKNNSARLVKYYYLTCQADFDKRWEEMVVIAEATGARIMMDPFPKHSKEVKFIMLERLAQIFRDDQTAKLHRLYNSCYGSMKPVKGYGRFLIDWDVKDTTILNKYIKVYNIEVCEVIPTRQGWHYLVKPFFAPMFLDSLSKHGFPNVDIHKTSPTLVYLPTSLAKYD